MDAVQRMRDRAARSGKLATTAEQQVIRVEDSGQPVYEILPTNPTVVYVPVYDPYWIWGAPVYYPYARWYYPPHAPYLYFGSAVYIDAYFGTRWYGSPWNGPGYQAWNNWGWRPAWNSHNVVVNNVFINNHHFNTNRSYGTGTIAWSHEVEHRRGVVYPSTASFDRYRRDSRDFSRPQQALNQGNQGRSASAQLTSRNAGTINASSASRPSERSSGRSDVRQDARPDTRQDYRQVSRPDTRQDTRVAGRDSTSSYQNRDNRASSDVRSDRGSSYQGSSRASSGTTPMTTTRSSQLALSRPSTPAPNVGSSQGSSWSGTRNPVPSRESQQGRNVGTPATRTETPTSYRGTTSDRGRQEYPSVRQAGPSAGSASPTYQASLPRQSSAPARQSAPEPRYAPAQRSAPQSNVQAAPRQSAPQSGAASAVRSAPAQHQESSSSNSQGSQGGGRSSNGGSNGGGNSRGRR
jgi:hypothetical protein